MTFYHVSTWNETFQNLENFMICGVVGTFFTLTGLENFLETKYVVYIGTHIIFYKERRKF